MNSNILWYRKKLRNHLHCSAHSKRALLIQFDHTLSQLLEECPHPTRQQLTDAFGPPDEMAKILLFSVPEKEKKHTRFWVRAKKVLFLILILFILAFGIYSYYLKEWSVITVYDDVYPITETILIVEEP